MREISLYSDQEWISACDLQQMMFALHNAAQAGSAIVEACQLGHIAGRAERMTGAAPIGSRKPDSSSQFAEMAWDVPIWFWRDFISAPDNQEWGLNRICGEGHREDRWAKFKLQGMHFHRSGLINLGLEASKEPEARQAKSGRKPTYDWPAACLAIFGEIHRGDLKPENQADIERALISHLSRGDKQPSESTVRPYAKQIWDETQKA